MQDFKGKVAFITGGGSGVALGQAKVFAKAGMKVVIADIRQDHLDQAMAYFEQTDAQVHPIRLDITDRKAMAEAADETERVFGPVQLLCNTAGVSIFGPMQQATYEDWDWIMNVNVGGVINGIQTFVPRMIEYGKGGHIVNTASMSGFTPMTGTGVYCTSKFAVRGLTESLRIDLEPHHIGVSVLCPGAVNSNIHEAVRTRPQHLANTGYYHEDEEIMKGLKAVIEPGLDPVILAEKVLEAIRNNELYIIPYAEFREPLIELHNRVLSVLPDPKDDPDMMKRVEAIQKSRSPQRQDAG
ncbi:SDR family NAD(P)-dependent oxidoreductase [Paenibacillus validus]|uniref:SDR family NAD(P)-dependent oxidoreductase n=1 Tax=Paenibacillus validus TaxID=44253 RepID=A0A7X3CQV7_9BACL|nr:MULTISPECIES: SDR family NAD(P)-dependent oxidoreductase [Paenibacillus]MED4601619.1 SDR family NAD(P)-dependent oxidoreductase [Paenibacillus validus]MED4605638.1 SDR family NAD(P)-dependent oxidoreductase [Paenibacillus validus]MUG70030.1 SDR family NAD(P)-dependent oxidoreductase [Paenibacillus validus]